ncbi:hypothetical protein [Nocardioides sp.]|uniref:hypothetical protein n=1 Tax=Nocardioides sp. TaxID=35761 RepID=UPI002D7F1E8C|nr:hypothetical protein [Nocardioides sp.]
MSGDFWETEVYGAAPLAGLERIEMEDVFGWLGRTLPVSGSKVDWSLVRGEHSHRHFVDGVEFADEAAREILRRMEAGSSVEHVGDSLSPFGIRFAGAQAGAIVTALLEVPEHHYFLDEGRAWLVVVSSEGDLDIVDQLDASDGS